MLEQVDEPQELRRLEVVSPTQKMPGPEDVWPLRSPSQ